MHGLLALLVHRLVALQFNLQGNGPVDPPVFRIQAGGRLGLTVEGLQSLLDDVLH